MSIIRALDNASTTPSQIGEKGHMEYSWSQDLRETTLQLHFQIVRGANVQTVMDIFERLIMTVQMMYYKNKTMSDDIFFKHNFLLYKMICHTRDVIDGKGEYMLSYALLTVWNKYYPESAMNMLNYFVNPLPCNQEHPYGSWKDIKNLCSFLQKHKFASNDNLMNHAVKLMNNQLAKDLNDKTELSLAAKWVPREKSSHGDLYEMFATHFFNHYIESAHSNKKVDSLHKAKIKAKMNYRKMVSSLNRRLDTVQIKQCSNNWRAIQPSKQTSITMKKQSKAFLNLNKDGSVRSNCLDRVVCGEKFREHIRNLALGRRSVSGKRIGINDFVRSALQLENSDEIDLLNAQWKDNALQSNELGKMIAMVDVSGSMEGDPMNAAIGLGIRVAEKSMLGKRIMTFSAVPTWVNLDDCNNFVEMVKKVRKADWGMNTNFVAALNMILDAIISQKMKPDDVEDMVLAIFSDMQIDSADHQSKCMMDLIEKKYADAGKRLWGKPFKVPHILFWNLRSTHGFPTLSSKRNVSMMSGFSPSLLNVFCEKGMSGLDSCSPWSLFLSSLDNPRYNFLANVLNI
jgi:hypothetical protein